MSNTDDFVCNVLIMGKTGTGKSSLLNYLCDSKVAGTGTGKPVTGEGIYEYTVKINGQEVRLFDSWGIEAGKTDRWYTLIENALEKHGVQKDMEDWFHCVIYCIQAGGGRVEDIDSAIIKKFLGEGYHLTIVLTKADQIDEDEEKDMKKVILKEIEGVVKAEKRGILKVVSTCAEEKKTRSGTTVPFGRDEAVATILTGWKETVIDRMPKHVLGKINEELDYWGENIKYKIDNEWKVSGWSNEKLEKDIADDAKRFVEKVKKEKLPIFLKDAVESCKKANASLKTAFEISIDTKWLNVLGEKSFWDHIGMAVAYTLGSIPMLITKLVFTFSKSKQAVEKEYLHRYIDGIVEKLKDEIAKSEKDIAKSIEQALQ